jgi:nitroimidazol reductase NimA-like FMN-containing flavoprotein (pyridoxamine 5'-phosphate oxidase superfamily)
MSQPTSHRKFTSHFAEIPKSRCEELLAQHKAGRVAWNPADGPKIMPVTYQYWNGMVVFRTAPDGPLASLTRRTHVAFEIDQIDEDQEKGWSVVVLGFSEGVTQRYTLSTLWRDGPVPWAGGVRNVFVAITPQSITGRAVKSADAD